MWFGMALALAMSGLSGLMASPQESHELEKLLETMHPDFRRYIRAVRPSPPGSAAADLYLALVRPHGRDPRLPGDRPRSGAGERYDLLVFPGASGPGISRAWSRLLVDHEYFHARHLARASGLPQPMFESHAANHHFHEALAWNQSLQRLTAGNYGALPPRRVREARQRYAEHRRALAQYVKKKQPSVWPYYVTLLPE